MISYQSLEPRNNRVTKAGRVEHDGFDAVFAQLVGKYRLVEVVNGVHVAVN
jgi:hypothetical protein